jgi:hypothetical protein
VIAYPWMTSMRKAFDDPAYEVWFLRFKNGSDGRGPIAHDGDGTYKAPVCDHNFSPPKCSELYHSQTQTPGFPHGDGNCLTPCDCGRVPCGFYLFDQRQLNTAVKGQTLQDFMVRNLTVSPTGLLHPAIDGEKECWCATASHYLAQLFSPHPLAMAPPLLCSPHE